MRYTLITIVSSILLIASQGVRAESNYSYSFGFGYNHNTGHGSKHGYGHQGYKYKGYKNKAYKYGTRHNYGNGYGNRHGYGHKPGYGHGHKYAHNYRHNPGYGYNYRYHGSHNNSGEIAGALLLGGAIGYGLSNTRQHTSYYTNYHNYYRDPYLNSRDIVYPGSRRVPVSTAPASRRLYKDRDGNCSEIIRNSLGDELRIQLDPVECNW